MMVLARWKMAAATGTCNDITKTEKQATHDTRVCGDSRIVTQQLGRLPHAAAHQSQALRKCHTRYVFGAEKLTGLASTGLAAMIYTHAMLCCAMLRCATLCYAVLSHARSRCAVIAMLLH